METKNNNVNFTPVIIYNNAETDKFLILSENKGKAAIYMWTHLESGKRYVGSAVDLSERLSQYFSLPRLKRADNYISRALLLHTHSAFSLTILEIIDISSKSVGESRKLILEREQFYMDSLGPEYNILKIAGSSLGYIHSVESKALISLAMSGENHPRGMFGKTQSIEAKAKISKASCGENNPMSKKVFVYSFDLETNEIKLYKTFNTYIEAGNHFDCSTRNISRYLDKNRLYKKQWILSSFNL